jgi:hypothetical protein
LEDFARSESESNPSPLEFHKAVADEKRDDNRDSGDIRDMIASTLDVDLLLVDGLSVDASAPNADPLKKFVQLVLAGPLLYINTALTPPDLKLTSTAIAAGVCEGAFSFPYRRIIVSGAITSGPSDIVTSLHAAFSCVMVRNYDDDRLGASPADKLVVGYPERYILSPFLASLVHTVRENATGDFLTILDRIGIHDQLFEEFAFANIMRSPTLFLAGDTTRSCTSVTFEKLPEPIPTSDLRVTLKETTKLKADTLYRCVTGQPYLGAICKATGTVKIVEDGKTKVFADQSVLLLFQMIISSSHPVKDVNAYRALVKGLMKTNKATSAMAIVVVPLSVTPTRRTMSSYTPPAAMPLTKARNTRDAAEVTKHTQNPLPCTAVLNVSCMYELFDTASVAYDNDASSEAVSDRAEDGILSADGRRVDGVVAQDVVPPVRALRGRRVDGVVAQDVVPPVRALRGRGGIGLRGRGGGAQGLTRQNGTHAGKKREDKPKERWK